MNIIRIFLRKINYLFLINKGAKVNAFENKFRNQSFSQEGEDMVLLRLFEGQNDGFFVDMLVLIIHFAFQIQIYSTKKVGVE